MTAAGERLGCSRSTIYRYLDRGLLVAHRDPVSCRVGIELPGVDALAAQRVVLSA
jgi:predicted DNA-binding transcriptional regulator AlpA